MRTVLSLLYILLIASVAPAWAGIQANNCKSAGEASSNKCTAHGGTAMAAGIASGGAAANASQTDVQVNSGTMMSEIDKQIAAVNQAIAGCEAELSDCKSKCDQYKGQVDRKTEFGPEVDGAKTSSCEQPINQKKSAPNLNPAKPRPAIPKTLRAAAAKCRNCRNKKTARPPKAKPKS